MLFGEFYAKLIIENDKFFRTYHWHTQKPKINQIFDQKKNKK